MIADTLRWYLWRFNSFEAGEDPLGRQTGCCLGASSFLWEAQRVTPRVGVKASHMGGRLGRVGAVPFQPSFFFF